MKKKHLILAICIVLLLGMMVVFNLFSPRPIVEDVGTSRIARIQYNPYFNQEMDARIEVSDYDEKEILDCLSRYTERRTLKRSNGYWIGDVELEVTIITGNRLKSILLGNDNCIHGSNNKSIYKILEADNLKSELLEMMDVRVN